MNYLSKLKDLMKIKRDQAPKNFFLIFSFLPFYLLLYVFVAMYHISHFFYKLLTSPIDYLEAWKTHQAENKKHATEAVIYYLTIPVLFCLQILSSLSTVGFMLLWVPINALVFLVTLGRVKWQAFLIEAKTDRESLVCEAPFALNKTWRSVYTYTTFAVTVILLISAVLNFTGIAVDVNISYAIWKIFRFSRIAYVALTAVASPFVFIKRKNTQALAE